MSDGRNTIVPRTETDLVLHKQKIAEVKAFLQHPTSRLLILQGPSGSGKTTCVQCLTNDLGIDLIEWMNPSMPDPKQPALRPFAEFMHRAARYNSALPHKAPRQQQTAVLKRLILVKDLPHLANPRMRQDFLDIMDRFCQTAGPHCCCCLICNDYSLVNPLFATHHRPAQISFNAVAKTFLLKILQRQCDQSGPFAVDKSSLERIAANADGDIRQALHQLSFALIGVKAAAAAVETQWEVGRSKRKRIAATILPALDADHSKDSEQDLLHSVGRIMHNKRSVELSEAEQLLPNHLRAANCERPTSNYDVNNLTAGRLSDDIGLSLLYFNQNLPLFTDQVEQLFDGLQWLSEADVFASSAYGRALMGVSGSGGGEGASVTDPLRQSIMERYALAVASRGLLFSNWPARPTSKFQPIRKPIFFSALLELRQSQQKMDRLTNHFAVYYPACIGGSRQFRWNLEVLPFLYQMAVRQHLFFNQVPSAIKYDLLNSRARLQSARQSGSFWDDRITPQDWEAQEQLFTNHAKTPVPVSITAAISDMSTSNDELWFVGHDDISDISD